MHDTIYYIVAGTSILANILTIIQLRRQAVVLAKGVIKDIQRI